MGFLEQLGQTAAWFKQRVSTPLGKRERPKDQPDEEPLATHAAKRSRGAGCMGCVQYVVAVNGQERVVSDPSRDPMNDEITKVYKRKAKRQEPSAAVPSPAAVCRIISHSIYLEPVVPLGMHALIHLCMFPSSQPGIMFIRGAVCDEVNLTQSGLESIVAHHHLNNLPLCNSQSYGPSKESAHSPLANPLKPSKQPVYTWLSGSPSTGTPAAALTPAATPATDRVVGRRGPAADRAASGGPAAAKTWGQPPRNRSSIRKPQLHHHQQQQDHLQRKSWHQVIIPFSSARWCYSRYHCARTCRKRTGNLTPSNIHNKAM